MSRKPKSDAPATKRKSSKRRQPCTTAQALIQAVDDRAECISHKIDDLVEKLAPYPLQGG